jgi:hypothetical protein
MTTKVFSREFIYNVGKSSNGQRIYYSGDQIINCYQGGSKLGLTKQQAAKLRKIARKILQKEKDN